MRSILEALTRNKLRENREQQPVLQNEAPKAEPELAENKVYNNASPISSEEDG